MFDSFQVVTPRSNFHIREDEIETVIYREKSDDNGDISSKEQSPMSNLSFNPPLYIPLFRLTPISITIPRLLDILHTPPLFRSSPSRPLIS